MSNATVEDGILQRFSPSSIQKFLGCNRQYYYRYVLRLPDAPPSGAQNRGIEGHRRIAHYLTTGQDAMDPLERRGLHMMPTPGKDLLVEWNVQDDGQQIAVGEAKLNAFIDLVNPRDLEKLKQVEVVDWKFKGSLSRFRTTPYDLINPHKDAGVQMLVYAKKMADKWRNALAVVKVKHGMFQVHGRQRAEPIEAFISVDDVQRHWENFFEPTVRQMADVVQAKDIEQVPYNTKTCGKFNGCPYADKCSKFDKFAVMKTYFDTNKGEETDMGLFDDVSAAPAAVTKPPMIIDESTVPDAVLIAAKQEVVTQPLVGIVPPDAPASDPALAAEIEVPKVETPVVEAKAKKTRAKKADAVTASPIPTESTVATSNEGVHLYVNTVPVGKQVDTLVAYTAALEAEVLAKFGQTGDIRLADSQQFGFGKWRAYLETAALASPPAPGFYFVSRGLDEKVDAVAGALQRIAASVTIGM